MIKSLIHFFHCTYIFHGAAHSSAYFRLNLIVYGPQVTMNKNCVRIKMKFFMNISVLKRGREKLNIAWGIVPRMTFFENLLPFSSCESALLYASYFFNVVDLH